MSDNEIRQILIEKKREERRMQREEALQQRKEKIMEAAGGILAWASLFGLGYMAFLGAYMVG